MNEKFAKAHSHIMKKEAMHLLPVSQDESLFHDDDDNDSVGHAYEKPRTRFILRYLMISLLICIFAASLVFNLVLVNQKHNTRSASPSAYSESRPANQST
jgi:hypothetical protein